MDEDWLLLGVALVQELEEWCELRVAEIETLMVGQKHRADGAKLSAGVLNFFDTTGGCGSLMCSQLGYK